MPGESHTQPMYVYNVNCRTCALKANSILLYSLIVFEAGSKCHKKVKIKVYVTHAMNQDIAQVTNNYNSFLFPFKG